MRLLVDENMPLVPEFFGGFGEIIRLPGRHISRVDMQHADALLVRSVTRVDRALLEGTPVRFVGTATIGTDHIDRPALAALGISLASAPGCNARAVGEYVATVLAILADEQGWQPEQRTLGVVGLGNTGRQVIRLARALGFRVLGCDPLVTWPEVEQRSFAELLVEADIFSLHVPLTRNGPHPTHHLVAATELAALRPGSILVNSSRGAVVSNAALLDALMSRPGELTAVLDVWEGEPALTPALLERVRFGTPHVAGYSQEGKWQGTALIYRAFCDFFQLPAVHELTDLRPAELPAVLTIAAGTSLSQVRREVLQQACPVIGDDAALRATLFAADPATAFDALRKNHPPRREFTAHRVVLPPDHPAHALLKALGFPLV